MEVFQLTLTFLGLIGLNYFSSDSVNTKNLYIKENHYNKYHWKFNLQ